MPTPINFNTSYEEFQDFTPEQIILIHRMYEFNNLSLRQALEVENAALRNDFLDGIETLTDQGLLPGALPNPLTDSEQRERIELVRDYLEGARPSAAERAAARGRLRNLIETYLEPTDGFINAYSNLSDVQRAQLLQNASDTIDEDPLQGAFLSDDALEATRAAANPQEAERLTGEDAVNFFLAREQAVLSFLTERILTDKLSLEQTNQENIIQVSDENAALLVNHIQKRQSLLDFFRIRTPNLSLIVPRIRLYKVLYEEGRSEEVDRFEFIFNSFTSEDKISQITETKFGRGEGSGIKSVTWDYEGTNPETVRSFVNFNLSLFLQNLSDLFDSNLGEEVFKIEDNVDLIQLIGAGVGVEREDGSRFNYNIRAELGWTVSSHISADLCSDQTIEDLRKIIEQVSTPIELNLKEHQINFNNDGTLTLDLTYFAAIDEMMTDNSMNVLAIGGLEGIASVQEAREQEAEEAAADARSTLGGERDPTVDNCSPARSTDRAASDAEQGDEEEPTITETEVLSSLASRGEQNILNNYNELFNRLINGGNIYSLEFNSADLAEAVKETNWDWLTGIAGGSLSISSELLTVAALQELRSITLQVSRLENFDQNAIGNTQINNARTQARRDNVDAGELIDDVFSDENLREALNNRVLNRLSASDDGKYEINFIRLGDLLDTVIEGLKEVPGSALNRQQNNLNFISSLYYYRDAISGDKKAYNYCNMLITIDSFRQFFVEKIVKDLKTVYSLKNFIIDLINKFSYVESLKVQTTRTFVAAEGRPAFTVFQGPDVGLQTAAQLQALGEELNVLDISVPTLEGIRRRNIVTNLVGLDRRLNTFEVSTNLTNYFIIHSTSFAVIGEGKEEEDIARGIYHITVGADKGILKNVSFRRDEIAGRREGRIVSAGGLNLSALREKYDVTITTFGAPFFFPGMYFYLNPNMVGMGRPSADFSAANILGLGGYYFINKVSNSISEDMRFETTIEASWNSDGSGLGPDGCRVGPTFIIQPGGNGVDLLASESSVAIGTAILDPTQASESQLQQIERTNDPFDIQRVDAERQRRENITNPRGIDPLQGPL